MERIIIILLVYIAIKVTFIEIKMSKINDKIDDEEKDEEKKEIYDLEELDTRLHTLYKKLDIISKSLEE